MTKVTCIPCNKYSWQLWKVKITLNLQLVYGYVTFKKKGK